MNTIEVDFDVFKQLTILRASEEVSYNDVIRELLGLGKSQISKTMSNSPDDWIVKGVHFPAGTEFRGKSKNQTYTARVEKGGLFYDGKKYSSPSAAASAVTGTPNNGWRFWECRMPNTNNWLIIENLRR